MTEQTDGSATGPLAGRLLEQPRALSVDDCLDSWKDCSLHDGGEEYLLKRVLGLQGFRRIGLFTRSCESPDLFEHKAGDEPTDEWTRKA